ncbi:MAG: hypothetical protein CMM60_09080 [Rhodospirillaceae bacterium]|mgnify:CR=1 FL=1|jgi:hypothetical protein|nr:hypothetical protein [Rhodospirillaceae bacterium]|tara:strand:+ start:10153 stop:10338 length:186 start_codon:yes stop_codon:yes gene_type:complete
MSDISTGGFLAGKKTYITAITGIVGALGAYLVGDMNLIEAFQVVWPLISVAFLRKGIAAGR